MQRFKFQMLVIVMVLVIAAIACEGSVSTANIKDAYLATDVDGANRTTVFSQDAVFYVFVDLANAPDDTTLKAVWIAVNVQDTDPNLQINETEFTSGDALVHFQLENTDYLWPIGQYKVDIYLNGTLDQTLTFEVQ
jgi:hypothetical protein